MSKPGPLFATSSLNPCFKPRCQNGLTEMCQRLEDIHAKIASEYSKGIVRGYTKELLGHVFL